jgi:hypothetical protein
MSTAYVSHLCSLCQPAYLSRLSQPSTSAVCAFRLRHPLLHKPAPYASIFLKEQIPLVTSSVTAIRSPCNMVLSFTTSFSPHTYYLTLQCLSACPAIAHHCPTIASPLSCRSRFILTFRFPDSTIISEPKCCMKIILVSLTFVNAKSEVMKNFSGRCYCHDDG